MLRDNVDARQCSYFELGLPVGTVALKEENKKKKRMKGTYWSFLKNLLASNHEFRSRFWFKAASQIDGTNVKRIAAFRVV